MCLLCSSANMVHKILAAGKQAECEQRFVIKFFASQGDSPIAIWTRLRRLHGPQTLSQTAVRNWVRHFQDDPTASCLDKPRCRGPRTARSARNINRIRRLVADDRRLTLRELALLTKLSMGSVHKILRDDLKMKKIAAHFVPKLLTADQRLKRMVVSQQNLDKLACEPLMLRHIVSGDESWIYTFDPVRKHQASTWVSPGDE